MWGHMLHIPTREIYLTPVGLLYDMVACQQIAEGAEEKQVVQKSEDMDEDMIPDLA